MELNLESGVAIYMQIAQKIIDEIQKGRLRPSTAMPGTRLLANSLGLNRRTVVMAFDELIAQGWLCAESRRGTFVSSNIPNGFEYASNLTNKFQLDLTSPNTSVIHSSINDQKLSSKLFELNDGTPDSRLIPFEVLSRAFRHALIYSSRTNRLGYDNPRGQNALRSSISVMLNMERGLHVDADQICIVRGSQMGIFLVARVLTRLNDNVVFENLTYPAAREAFKSCGANILTVGVDDHGIKVDELELLCKQHTIRAIYVTPHHQYPTTVMMLAERRIKLLMLAEKYDFVILEDDYDHEFHFSQHPVLPLASGARNERVIYVGSLSKILAPGLRVGYIAAPKEFSERCAAEIMIIDRQGNSITELAVSELMDKGIIKHHIRKTLKIYNQRRILLANLLNNELRDLIDFETPNGGLAFWLKLKSNLNDEELFNRVKKENFHISNNSVFTLENSKSLAIRLGFGNLDNNEIEIVVNGLKRILMN